MAISSRVVLIVTEEERTRAAFSRGLAHEPHRVLTASRISEALERMAAEPVDLIVSDTLLPDGPGQAFLRDVRRRYPDTMRILLTPVAGLATAVEAMERGEIYRFRFAPGTTWSSAALSAARSTDWSASARTAGSWPGCIGRSTRPSPSPTPSCT